MANIQYQLSTSKRTRKKSRYRIILTSAQYTGRKPAQKRANIQYQLNISNRSRKKIQTPDIFTDHQEQQHDTQVENPFNGTNLCKKIHTPDIFTDW